MGTVWPTRLMVANVVSLLPRVGLAESLARRNESTAGALVTTVIVVGFEGALTLPATSSAVVKNV